MKSNRQYREDEILDDKEEYLEFLRSEHADSIRKERLISARISKPVRKPKAETKVH